MAPTDTLNPPHKHTHDPWHTSTNQPTNPHNPTPPTKHPNSFPNMLAETGFVTHMGPSVQGDCEPFQSYGWNPPEVRAVRCFVVGWVWGEAYD